jgi:hypothetical protein
VFFGAHWRRTGDGEVAERGDGEPFAGRVEGRTPGGDREPGAVKPPPTDFQLLRAIYERHRDEYLEGHQTRIDVPIDIPAIAQDLGVGVNSVFGRLYHHLDPLYGTQNEDGSRKTLFYGAARDDKGPD